MIELVNVTKWFPTEFGRHYVFRDVSLKLPDDKSVGVIGPNGAGKSTFLRIIAGADMPNEGRVIRSGRISPPMGLTPSLLTSLTGAENARFACRIYGMDRDEMEDVVENVRDLAGIGKFYEMPVNTYSAGMRQRVAFSINMMLRYDYYLFDEIGAGGDRDFREISKRMVQERLATSKFVITSHQIDELVGLCEACIVIMNGELKYFDKIADGISYYDKDFDPSKVERKREIKAKRKERKALIASGQEPPSREERLAAKRELKKQKIAARAAERQEAGKAEPQDGAPKKARRRKKKSRKAAQGPAATEMEMAALPAAGIAPAAPRAGSDSKPAVPPIRIPARAGLPMAPRIPPPPAESKPDASRETGRFHQLLLRPADTTALPEPDAMPELAGGGETPPAAAKPSRKDRRMLRMKRRKARVKSKSADSPPDSGPAPAPVSANDSPEDTAPPGPAPAGSEETGLHQLATAGDAAADGGSRRKSRIEARRLRRRLARGETEQTQPKTGTAD